MLPRLRVIAAASEYCHSGGGNAWRWPSVAASSSFPLSTLPSPSDDPTSTSASSSVSVARDILDHAAVVSFREQIIERESQRRLSMPQRELEDAALEAGAASDRRGAADLVAALHVSGFILRYRGNCFLRPDEIADVVLRALPDSEAEVGARLEELRAQLAPLEQAKKRIDNRARTRTRAVLVAGFCLLSAQLGTFLYLTFGSAHWGWDATEPLTYFSGQTITLLAYAYYLTTRRAAADYSSLEEQLRDRFSATATKEQHDFCPEKYEILRADVERYQRYARGAIVKKEASSSRSSAL